MSAVMPYSSQYLVSHLDLVKFGLDMTKKAKPASGGPSKSINIESLISAFYLPQIIYSGDTSEVIEIFRKMKRKKQLKSCRIRVDRETGYVIESKEEFSDIAKFDPETFPEKPKESLKNVGYWNILNQYISAN